jgi:Tfp pilus assembly protein PilF
VSAVLVDSVPASVVAAKEPVVCEAGSISPQEEVLVPAPPSNGTLPAADPLSTHNNVTSQSSELSAGEVSARNIADQYIATAKAYLSTNQAPELALKQLKVAMKKAPTYPEPYMVRGNLYISLGDLKSASADFLKIFTELDERNATSANKLTEIATQMLLAGNLTSEGHAIFATMNTTAPKDERFCLALATALAQKGEYYQALNAVFEIDPSEPKSSERAMLTARLYELSGLTMSAAETLVVAIHDKLASWTDLGVLLCF